MRLPLGLPSLPLNGTEPDGTEATLHRTNDGRWYARVWDDAYLVDQTFPELSAAAVVAALSRDFPATSFDPEGV